MTMIMEGVKVTWYDDDPPVLVEGEVDGCVFALKIWKKDWEFRVAHALVDLRMGIESVYIERSPLEGPMAIGTADAKRGPLTERAKEVIKFCVANYRRGSGHP